MICNRTVEKFCIGNISKIENYEKAMKDETQVWDCHHRAEILPCGNFSRDTLKKFGLYYDRQSNELIFLTHSDHTRLHKKGKRNPSFEKHPSEDTRMKISLANKGRHPSEETRRKISEKLKGRTLSEETRRKMREANKRNKNSLGHHHSEETRMKMRDSHIGRTFSEEQKRKISEAMKAWWEKKRLDTSK